MHSVFSFSFLDDFFLYRPTCANFTWRLYKVCPVAFQAGVGLRMKWVMQLKVMSGLQVHMVKC